MDNQHRHIRGYRELTEEEITLVNSLKDAGNNIGALIAAMERDDRLDQRWVAIAKTHLQQGMMAVVRAVTKPEGF